MNTKTSNLEDHLGYWLRCLSNYIHESFAQKLLKHDVSVAQWVVLRSLYEKDNITLNKLAENIGVDKSSLSRMIERLVQKKLVIRKNGADRRSVSLSLTLSGKKLVPTLAALADENDREFFNTLPLKKQKELLATVHDLLKSNGWNGAKRGKDKME